MKFQNPQYLWLLLTIIIPIIIHLFQFRKFKTEYFSNVNLLKKLNIEKKKISQLRRLIILTLRIVTICTLTFVFAKPYIPKSTINTTGQQIVNIYIDNSPSMEEQMEAVTLLDDAKQKAKQIILKYDNSSIFRIYYNNSPINPPLLNKNEAIVAVDNIFFSFKRQNLSSTISAFNMTVDDKSATTCFYISDFQITTTDFENLKDSNTPIFFVPITNKYAKNIFIDNIAFDSPVSLMSDFHTANITVENKSETDFEKIPIKLFINEKLITTASFDIKSNSSINLQLSFPDKEAGIKNGYVVIDDKAISYDNYFYFTYKVQKDIKILDIYDTQPNKYVSTVFELDSIFNFTSTHYKSIRYDQLKYYDLIVLDGLSSIPDGLTGESQSIIPQGINYLILTDEDIDIISYNSFFEKFGYGTMFPLINNNDKNMQISFESNFFDGVFYEMNNMLKMNIDYPEIYRYFPLEANKSVVNLIKLSDKKSSIFSYLKISNGNIFFLSTPINNTTTNLQNNSIFIPLIYKTAFSNLKANNISYYPNDIKIPVSVNSQNISNCQVVCLTDSTFNAYYFDADNTNVNICFNNELEPVAGNYLINLNNKVIDGFSINNYREESILKFYDENEIKDFISDSKNLHYINSKDNFENSISTLINDSPLWKLFLIICIIALLAETILLRIWE
ncbi:MAG: BatA domain-containing protein [Bacteroidales bacterium]|jgi:hypothetical protein|nr:BatA domain-containing protein [Bacteroidales bacterium]MDD2205563.1 BatA domain-containing protein [Bacteroidales bacterium]MDD3914949.1 BatA domain-containing protein [Bacteroidales bacterium]MDD4634817.1 BatA domain-containing protein [Bacteroidales bacterium]